MLNIIVSFVMKLIEISFNDLKGIIDYVNLIIAFNYTFDLWNTFLYVLKRRNTYYCDIGKHLLQYTVVIVL